MLIRIGTRGSRLALAQARQVLSKLRKLSPNDRFKLIIVKTFGDEYQSVEIFRKTNVGVFTKEIEKRLLSGAIDIAVHSLKDLPTDLAKGLKLAAIPKRAAVEDVLISRKRCALADLPRGARVGTGSPRRKSQLRLLRPDLAITDLRGNLDTRVAKVLKEKSLDAVIVAGAGVERLGKFKRYCRTIPSLQMLPAAGQGALGIQIRSGDSETERVARLLNDPVTEVLAQAERRFLKELHGGCRVPVGILTQRAGKRIRIVAAVFSVKSGLFVRAEIRRPFAQADQAGKLLAQALLKKGARRFLSEARASH